MYEVRNLEKWQNVKRAVTRGEMSRKPSTEAGLPQNKQLSQHNISQSSILTKGTFFAFMYSVFCTTTNNFVGLGGEE